MKHKITAVLLACMVATPSMLCAEPTTKAGFYLRERYEYYRNPFDLSDDAKDNRSYFRTKTSLWGQADLDERVSLFAKLSNENKAFTYFGGTSPSFPDKQASKKEYHFDFDEIYFENLYVDLKQVMGAPVDLRIGRQDLAGQYGENFLILDGTPVDGPRSTYFNALKAAWAIDPNNTLDAIYTNNTRTDQLLPVINERGLIDFRTGYKVNANYLTTTDEQGYVLYWKNKAVKNLNFEGYYIHKYESPDGGAGVYTGQKTRLNTVGAAAKYDFAPFALRAQGAGQWGSYGLNDREGYGGYVYLDRDLPEVKVWSPSITAGWFYLSGDDRNTTSKNEGWDPLFSQYPWISDLYLYVLTRETSVPAYWTNIHGLRTYLILKPSAKSKATFTYLYLRAVEEVPNSANTIFSGRSKDRGQSLQAKMEYFLNNNVTLSTQAEYFIPSDFYTTDDQAIYVRGEIIIKF